MVKKFFPAGVLALCLSLCGCTARYDPQSAQKAQEAAQEYLQYIDNGKYGESWDNAGKYFRQTVTREDWEKSLKTSRAPLGKVVSRGLRARQFTNFIPGAPRAKYVTLTFRTSYSDSKANIVEIVTVLKDFDGKWKVVGFFIL